MTRWTASTPGSPAGHRRPRRTPRATTVSGNVTASDPRAWGPSNASTLPAVAGQTCAICSPASAAASAASSQAPRALPRMATRSPPGGCGRAPGDVEQLLERVDADDPGLVEQGGDGGLGPSGRGGEPRLTCRAGARPDFTATMGLASTPGGRSARTSGVAEALQVEEDDIGLGVVLPVLEQVVATHVEPCRRSRRTTRSRGPAGWPTRAARCPRHPTASGSRPDPVAAAPGRTWRSRPSRCWPRPWSWARPPACHPAGPHRGSSARPRRPPDPSRRSRRRSPPDPSRPSRRTAPRPRGRRRRYGDDRKVHLAGYVERPWGTPERWPRGRRPGSRGTPAPRTLPASRSAKRWWPIAAGASAGTDDRHRRGREDALDRPRLGAVLTAAPPRHGPPRWRRWGRRP